MDPITAIGIASTAYSAIKKGFEVGKEVESMAGDLGRWMNAINAVKTSHSKAKGAVRQRGGLAGDVFVPGGQYLLGGARSQPWVFDAERYAHPVMVEAFEISKAPVTNAE